MQTIAGVYKYRSARRLKWALFILNVIGAIVYVRAASVAWAIPEERAQGIYSVTGEPLIWALSVLPVFASFCLIDLVWGAFILVKRVWRDGYLWLSSFAIWLIAIGVDFSHH